eukprot:Amastigsp_a340501_134.p2 type:complete len:147 gc:universal Amastigsp_a340501_134:492-52(-)
MAPPDMRLQCADGDVAMWVGKKCSMRSARRAHMSLFMSSMTRLLFRASGSRIGPLDVVMGATVNPHRSESSTNAAHSSSVKTLSRIKAPSTPSTGRIVGGVLRVPGPRSLSISASSGTTCTNVAFARASLCSALGGPMDDCSDPIC